VAIVNDDDVTVFDSSTRPGTARMVIAEIRKITNKPVTMLINSHWHMDHWSGNDEYVRAFPGLQIISTAQTREYMTRMGASFFADSIGGGLPQAKASLATAIETGKQKDGTDLTPMARAQREKDIAETESFAREMANVPRVLPNLVFHDRLTFWRGRREFRLRSETGDATASAVLYLPAEKLLVMGDVLVRPETGDGPPPWTTNSYAIAGWARSLRDLEGLDATIVVPGQGAAFHDKAYLSLTADLFASIVAQVHSALERGLVALDAVQAAVNVDSLGLRFTPGARTPSASFKRLVTTLVRKAYQESLDGARS
jgi:glyoxylase-like metal-dependent hydrolase (beta-lactamase superfamily II)